MTVFAAIQPGLHDPTKYFESGNFQAVYCWAVLPGWRVDDYESGIPHLLQRPVDSLIGQRCLLSNGLGRWPRVCAIAVGVEKQVQEHQARARTAWNGSTEDQPKDVEIAALPSHRHPPPIS
jgi:hypothetical protein